jgi:hypothetical protein
VSRLDRVTLQKQTALGTKNTTVEYTIPVEGCEPRLQRTEMTKEETDGTKFPTDQEYGTRFWEVPMSGAARVSSLPRILSGFLGPPTTTTPGGGVTSRKHSFDPVGKTLVPLSGYVTRMDPSPTVINDLFWDMLGNDLTLAIAPNDWLSFDASFIARDRDPNQSTPSGSYDLSRRLAFHTFAAFISVNGAAEVAMPLERFSIAYSNGIPTDQPQLGSRLLYKVREGNVGATISFNPKSGLDAHYARGVLDGDPDNVKVRLLATGPIIEGAIPYQVELIAYRAQYNDAPAPVAAGSTLDDLAVTARCAMDFTANKFVDVNVTNAVTTY